MAGGFAGQKGDEDDAGTHRRACSFVRERQRGNGLLAPAPLDYETIFAGGSA